MGIGVGVLKEEYAYDLNAAAFSFNSKDLTNKKQYASQVYGIFFHFSTNTPKVVTITLQRVSNNVTYNIYRLVLQLPNDISYVWKNELELPVTVNLLIDVAKTSAACTLNLLVPYK